MATEFQTSFIPKQVDPGYGGSRVSSTSLFTLVAVIIFVGTAAASGFYVLRYHLIGGQVEALKVSIDRNVALYDPPFIDRASELAKRISVTRTLLQNHVAVSELFRLLERTTSIDVSYDGLSFSRDADGSLRVEADGVATSYPAIVAQSDAYGQTTMIDDLIFTGLNRNLQGLIEFDLTAKIDPRLINFVTAVSERNAPVPVSATTATSTRTAPVMRTTAPATSSASAPSTVSPSQIQQTAPAQDGAEEEFEPDAISL